MACARRAVAPGFAAAAAARAAEHLCASALFRAAHTLALYAPLAGELSTAPLCARARARGLRVLWPRVGADGALAFCAAAPEELRAGRYGVLAPDARAPAVALGAGVLVVTPGLAFDRAGVRLGRGGGGYDRALAQAGGALAVGLGFAFQQVARVPCAPHDVPVHAVVTEAGLRRARPNLRIFARRGGGM